MKKIFLVLIICLTAFNISYSQNSDKETFERNQLQKYFHDVFEKTVEAFRMKLTGSIPSGSNTIGSVFISASSLDSLYKLFNAQLDSIQKTLNSLSNIKESIDSTKNHVQNIENNQKNGQQTISQTMIDSLQKAYAQHPTFTDTVKIDSTYSMTGMVDLGNYSLVAIRTPAYWTSASITFLVSIDGTNFYDLYYQDIEWNMICMANKDLTVNFNAFFPYRYLKIRSGTRATPVAQGNRTFTIIAKML